MEVVVLGGQIVLVKMADVIEEGIHSEIERAA
jgi:hypothetical protein